MKIKKYIPLSVKRKMIEIMSNNDKYTSKYSKEDKKIVMALAADYGNLGDIAITYAQKEFLLKNFKEYKIIEVLINDTYTSMKSLKKIVGEEDIISVIGGGNFGNIYSDIEGIRQFFIKKFPKNKIVCFPQTIDFTNDTEGRKKFKKAIKIYGNHKNLVLFAREEKSYKIMKENFKNNKVYLVPDIVLSLNKQEPKENREKITICFRNDKENKMTNNEKEKLVEMLRKKYKNDVIMQDTHIGDVKINKEEREKYLEKIWTTFRKSKLVLTDRLHGMIFCAITGTPCIAFPNSNGKIEGTYNKWLKNISYIQLATKDNDLNIQIEKLLNIGNTNVVEKVEEYETLIQSIKN